MATIERRIKTNLKHSTSNQLKTTIVAFQYSTDLSLKFCNQILFILNFNIHLVLATIIVMRILILNFIDRN